jgi:crotonobetainyl-CoA:carnitine CoA-transferase CaiB-like acyl-CoA transferase
MVYQSVKEVVDAVLKWCRINFPRNYASEFYVGITNDPQRRWREHGQVTPFGIFECKNREIAAKAEQQLVNEHDFQGGTGGGEEDSRFLYCYKR